MNKDPIKDAAANSSGKIQEEPGISAGSAEQQAKNVKNPDDGKVQQPIATPKEAVKDASKP